MSSDVETLADSSKVKSSKIPLPLSKVILLLLCCCYCYQVRYCC